MAQLSTTVEHDLDADVTTVTVYGDLDLGTAATLRSALLKALVDCPVAIIADLTSCHVTTPIALAVFPAVVRLGISRPSVLIAVAGLGDEHGSAALGAVSTFPTAQAARVAIATK